MPLSPSPIERISEGLWVKRDDRLSPIYGGNKARKLRHLFDEARDRGARRVVTLGAAGSHQVVATAIWGAHEGFDVAAVLVPQPHTTEGVFNLRAALAAKLRPLEAPSWKAAEGLARAALDPKAYFIPLGGSNATGSLGLVEAARELALSVKAGELPEPELLVVATGSGGTAAGLAVGLEREGLRTRVLGVTIAKPERLLSALATRLIEKTSERVGLSAAQRKSVESRLTLDARWVGEGYALSTPEGRCALEAGAAFGLALDPTYSAKAFACALALSERSPGRPVLFWHTLSTAPLTPWLENAPELPENLARLFR
jgi:D-cysteine desulfhydrase